VAPVLLWTPGAEGTGWARSLALRALAWEANTLRVGGDLRTAERAFRRLRARMARELVDDSALYAEVGSLEASLRMAQGALEAARQALDEAVLLYRSAGERVPLARVLMQRAIVERREGRSGAAVATQQEVLTLLDPERDRELHLMGVANLALYLVELERWSEARELMAAHQEALEEASLWQTANVRILRSRLARAGGSADEAERLLLEARADLIAREDPLRAAVVSLDLAVIYLEQGRTAELRRMARLMETIFESQDLHDEAMAALLLFRQAVAADTVTVEALFALRRRLEGQASPRRRRPAATHADAPS
jgi:tetratricopeptide (TPR) repeat protein